MGLGSGKGKGPGGGGPGEPGPDFVHPPGIGGTPSPVTPPIYQGNAGGGTWVTVSSLGEMAVALGAQEPFIAVGTSIIDIDIEPTYPVRILLAAGSRIDGFETITFGGIDGSGANIDYNQ